MARSVRPYRHASAGLKDAPQFVHVEPWPSHVYHPVAVRAEELQLIEAGPIARPQRVHRPRVVALNEVPTPFPIRSREVEGAHFADDAPEAPLSSSRVQAGLRGRSETTVNPRRRM
jgi:hypothetical protein